MAQETKVMITLAEVKLMQGLLLDFEIKVEKMRKENTSMAPSFHTKYATSEVLYAKLDTAKRILNY